MYTYSICVVKQVVSWKVQLIEIRQFFFPYLLVKMNETRKKEEETGTNICFMTYLLARAAWVCVIHCARFPGGNIEFSQLTHSIKGIQATWFVIMVWFWNASCLIHKIKTNCWTIQLVLEVRCYCKQKAHHDDNWKLKNDFILLRIHKMILPRKWWTQNGFVFSTNLNE